jgi:hypothetical protein
MFSACAVSSYMSIPSSVSVTATWSHAAYSAGAGRISAPGAPRPRAGPASLPEHDATSMRRPQTTEQPCLRRRASGLCNKADSEGTGARASQPCMSTGINSLPARSHYTRPFTAAARHGVAIVAAAAESRVSTMDPKNASSEPPHTAVCWQVRGTARRGCITQASTAGSPVAGVPRDAWTRTPQYRSVARAHTSGSTSPVKSMCGSDAVRVRLSTDALMADDAAAGNATAALLNLKAEVSEGAGAPPPDSGPARVSAADAPSPQETIIAATAGDLDFAENGAPAEDGDHQGRHDDGRAEGIGVQHDAPLRDATDMREVQPHNVANRPASGFEPASVAQQDEWQAVMARPQAHRSSAGARAAGEGKSELDRRCIDGNHKVARREPVGIADTLYLVKSRSPVCAESTPAGVVWTSAPRSHSVLQAECLAAAGSARCVGVGQRQQCPTFPAMARGEQLHTPDGEASVQQSRQRGHLVCSTAATPCATPGGLDLVHGGLVEVDGPVGAAGRADGALRRGALGELARGRCAGACAPLARRA